MENYDELFNPQVTIEEPAQSEVYKVSAKNGKNGVYKSVIRFIPYITNPTSSYVYKKVSWVKNPVTKKGMYVDDPKTIGEESPVSKMFFTLYGTNNEAYKKYAKEYLSTSDQYASIVQIIQDENHPEYVGQLKVFTYGKKIFEKIKGQLHPESQMIEANNPFDPIHGRYFFINCESKSGFNNFDKSMFIDSNGSKSGMLIPTQNGSYAVVDDTTDKGAIVNFLKENSPSLEKYKFTPWTEAQTNHVMDVLSVIKSALSNGTIGTESFQVLGTNSNQPGSYSATAMPIIPGADMKAIKNNESVGFATPTVQSPMNFTPSAPQSAPKQTNNISIDLPNVEPQVVENNGGDYTNSGIGGDIDDILSNL